MSKRESCPFDELGTPMIRDEELAMQLEKKFGWRYKVDDSDQVPDPRGVDPLDPTGELAEAFRVRREQILRIEYRLPEVNPEVAALVWERLGIVMPVSEEE